MLRTFADDLADARPATLVTPKARRPRRWTNEEILDALRQWAAAHDGLAPSKRDWTGKAGWPGAETVVAHFTREAVKAGARWEVQDLCDCPPVVLHCGDPVYTEPYVSEARLDFGCPAGQCKGHEEVRHPPDDPRSASRHSHWEGMSGWQYALSLAGLQTRIGGANAKRSERHRFGRNRQMVTGQGFGDTIPGSVKHFGSAA